MSSIKRDKTTGRETRCENFLYGFKAARRAARAAASAPWPSLPLALPLRPGQRRSAGAKGIASGAAETQEVTGAAADLTREPSRRPTSGSCGQPEASPIRGQAYGPPPLVKSAAPSAPS